MTSEGREQGDPVHLDPHEVQRRRALHREVVDALVDVDADAEHHRRTRGRGHEVGEHTGDLAPRSPPGQRDAVRVLDQFPGGTLLAELAPITDAAQVPQAILGAIGLAESLRREQPGQADALSLLVDQLSDRRALIVLDNCEHLVEAAARTAAELLARCP